MGDFFHRRLGLPNLLRPWSVCFAIVTVIIITCMMLPAFFGLQKFTQWGGMYTDSWCRMFTYAADPKSAPDVQSEWVQASTVGPGSVFSAPMHNHLSCLMWGRTVQCGRTTKDGWKVAWVSPEFKGQRFYDPYNACDVPLDPNAEWFRSKLDQ